MPYEPISHTADLACRVWAPSRDRLFDEAVRALTDLLTGYTPVEPRDERSVRCEADDLDVLLHELLAEVLFLFDARRWLTASASASVAPGPTGWRVDARLRGEPFAPDRHAIANVIKAVTYHQLSVVSTGDRWEATIVFDI